jgi:hypothetical protein
LILELVTVLVVPKSLGQPDGVPVDRGPQDVLLVLKYVQPVSLNPCCSLLLHGLLISNGSPGLCLTSHLALPLGFTVNFRFLFVNVSFPYLTWVL